METKARNLVLTGVLALFLFTTHGWAWAQEGGQQLPSLRVTNHRDVEVVVYLERGTFGTRLGAVAPHAVARLDLPHFVVRGSEAQVFVHPEGGIDLATPPFEVEEGTDINIVVPLGNVGYRSSPPPETIPTTGQGATTVTVRNHRGVAVTLFLEHGRFDTRLGEVPANQERTLTIPDWLTREGEAVEFFVHLEGGFDLNSQIFGLTPGAHFLIVVPAL